MKEKTELQKASMNNTTQRLRKWLQTDWARYAFAGVVGAVVAFALVISLGTGKKRPLSISELQALQMQQRAPEYAAIGLKGERMPDFREASKQSLPAVVHIKALPDDPEEMEEERGRRRRDRDSNPFKFFFEYPEGMPPGFGGASGSGVILSADGYIVTNNHVVEDGNYLQVILFDNRTFEARLIGTDPSTDLALLKVDGQDLPFLPFGNSDELEIGEWVLALGNPYDLTSTVTAGIVSAKGRSIGILEDRYRIESFIQTDAAINPGNSGGALINPRGELVGINTAIASRTGSYVGYGFAVPVNIVRKVVDDLKMYGEVQRGLLGVQIADLSPEYVEDENLRVSQGVLIAEVNEESAAEEAGLQKGDVITHVEGRKVRSSSELQERVARMRPGDEVELTFLRDGQKRTTTAVLQNQAGQRRIVENTSADLEDLGANLEELNENELAELDLDYGVRVRELESGPLLEAGMREGFIITHIDKKPVYDEDDVLRALSDITGGVLIAGVYPDGSKAYYAFGY